MRLTTALLLVVACVGCQAHRNEHPSVTPRAPNAVAIIAMEPFALGAKPCRPEKVAACVRREIDRVRPELRVVSSDEFQAIAFPGLTAEETPHEPKYVTLLIEDDTFRDRIAPLGLHYLVVVGGLTTTRDLWGDMLCGAGYGGGGCVGLMAAEEETRLVATVFDVKRSDRLRDVTAADQSREYFAMFVIFPFFKPGVTLPEACRDVTTEILAAIDDLESEPQQGLAGSSPGRNR
jgi:hypothetical protein